MVGPETTLAVKGLLPVELAVWSWICSPFELEPVVIQMMAPARTSTATTPAEIHAMAVPRGPLLVDGAGGGGGGVAGCSMPAG
jgi:hypothetical protein